MSKKGGESPLSLAERVRRASSVAPARDAPQGDGASSLNGPQALSFLPVGQEEAQVAGQPLERVRWIRRAGDAFAIAARLLERGGVPQRNAGGVVVVRNVARRCEEPLGFWWESRRGTANRCEARLVVRCRACEGCVAMRRREWIARALRELATTEANGRRSWFVTLTLDPRWRHRLTVLAQAGGAPWSERPEGEDALSRARRAILGDWIALYVKRLRDVSAARFRYLAALETHTDGEFHVHLLVHEDLGEVSERAMRNAWKPSGFAQAKLVRATGGGFRRSASYVAKYMGKQSGFPRQRASLGYGQGGLRKT